MRFTKVDKNDIIKINELLGSEGSKDLLIDFLNFLLPIKENIVDLTFKDKLGRTSLERGAIFEKSFQERNERRTN